MERYLVTGGAGFIGSNMVEALLKQGKKVRIFDKFSSGKKSNLRGMLDDVEVVKGDVRDFGAVKKVVKGITHIFHFAAIRAVARSVDDPIECTEVNVNGTLHVLQAAQKLGVQRVVFASSSAVYGNVEHFPVREDDQPIPMSPYGVSKLSSEYLCQMFTRLYGLETVSLRYFNVYGPKQNPESVYSMVIPIFIECLIHNQSPEIHWDGRQSRDFVYVGDVVKANLIAMSQKKANGSVFNIGSQTEESVVDIFNHLRRILKKDSIRPRFGPKRGGDVRRTVADTFRARKILGFKTQTSFPVGLKQTVEWFLRKNAS